jgi:hypothetical protein
MDGPDRNRRPAGTRVAASRLGLRLEPPLTHVTSGSTGEAEARSRRHATVDTFGSDRRRGARGGGRLPGTLPVSCRGADTARVSQSRCELGWSGGKPSRRGCGRSGSGACSRAFRVLLRFSRQPDRRPRLGAPRHRRRALGRPLLPGVSALARKSGGRLGASLGGPSPPPSLTATFPPPSFVPPLIGFPWWPDVADPARTPGLRHATVAGRVGHAAGPDDPRLPGPRGGSERKTGESRPVVLWARCGTGW